MNKLLWTITDKTMTEDEARAAISAVDTWDIDRIYEITEAEARIMAERHEVVKGHDVYFIDFGGYFKFSYLVFRRGHHMRHASDFELHHPRKTRDQLYKFYRTCLKKKLFTEKGLAAKLKSYGDYTARKNYLTNYYCDMENHISCFGNFSDPEFEKQYEAETKDLYLNRITFGYCRNPEFVEKCVDLYNAVEAAKDAMNNDFEYWKKAFRYEFSNFECIYGGRYIEAASAATNGKPLNDVQKRAYKEAKREYENYYYDNDLI